MKNNEIIEIKKEINNLKRVIVIFYIFIIIIFIIISFNTYLDMKRDDLIIKIYNSSITNDEIIVDSLSSAIEEMNNFNLRISNVEKRVNYLYHSKYDFSGLENNN